MNKPGDQKKKCFQSAASSSEVNQSSILLDLHGGCAAQKACARFHSSISRDHRELTAAAIDIVYSACDARTDLSSDQSSTLTSPNDRGSTRVVSLASTIAKHVCSIRPVLTVN